MSRRRDYTVPALLVAIPLLVIAGPLIPDWIRFFLQVSLASGLAVLGVVVQMRAGLVSFGQGLYYCLGGYAAGMAGHFAGITDAFSLVALGIVVASGVAFLLGFLMSRYREIFFAMLSLAFSMILYGLLVKAEALGSTDGFNLPKATFLGLSPSDQVLRLAVYGLTCTVTLFAAMFLYRYLKSPMGSLCEAIAQNEIRVEYLGTSARTVVHVTYVVAAALSGAGGALAALANGHVDPEMANWTTSGQFVFVALLSGTGNVAAPLLGNFLLEMVRVYAVGWSPYTWQLILGATMLLVILFLPGGLWSLIERRKEGG
jgi:branched-chain amino acid transport system permease protein